MVTVHLKERVEIKKDKEEISPLGVIPHFN